MKRHVVLSAGICLCVFPAFLGPAVAGKKVAVPPTAAEA